MPTAVEFLIEIRDEANNSATSLAARAQVMRDQLEIIEDWDDSQIRTDMVNRLTKTIDEADRTAKHFAGLRDGAQKAAVSLDATVPPLPETVIIVSGPGGW